MELSTIERPSPEFIPSQQASAGRPAQLRLFDVPVPVDLRKFGDRVRASALGDPKKRPIVVLGGISADCFPSIRPDGSSGWWAQLVGDGQAINSKEFYIIGIDFAADDTGKAAPSTIDQARVLAATLDTIGVGQPAVFLGASYGGMVALALAKAEPQRVDKLVLVCAAHEPHPASTASRELQRRVVSLGLLAGRGDEALAIARGMAMLTYRTPNEFEQRFEGGITEASPLCCSKPGEYLRARGQAFRSVMSPGRFLSLSASIDRHNVDVSDISAPCLIIGAESDQLVLSGQLRELATKLDRSDLHLLDSLYGHDMFLKEAKRIGEIIGRFLATDR
ncbi:MAG TPA: alpha/beta fold hydrolase [Sphingomicrobium sp.]|nr:alpha/beta fold hydrolase [Sphingomicrobium sp.]